MLRLVGLPLLVLASGDSLARPRRALGRPGIAVALSFAVGAWALAIVASAIASGTPSLGWRGEIEQREGALTALALAGLFAGTLRSHRTPADAERTLDVALAGGAIAAAYALLQSAGLDPLRWANALTYHAGGAATLRPASTLGNPILLGAVLAAALAAAVARAASSRTDAWARLPLVALLAVAVVTPLSRGAWLAAGAGVLVAIVMARPAGGMGSGARVWRATAFALVPALLWGAFVMRAPVAARLAEGAGGGLGSSGARSEFARGAVALWRSHPWLGVGPDAFGLHFPSVQRAALWRDEWFGLPAHAHSAALQTLATLGLAGAFAGAAWLVCAAAAGALAWRRAPEWRATLAAAVAAVAALVAAGTLNVVGLAAAACFVVCSALLARAASPAAPPPASGRLTRGLAWSAAIAVAVVSIATAWPEWRALAAAGGARDALTLAIERPPDARGALTDHALGLALHATAMDEADDELWRLAADAALADAEAAIARRAFGQASTDVDRAEAAARAAMARVPMRAANRERVANALALRARLAQRSLAPDAEALALRADAAYDSASRLAPVDPLLLAEQARAALALGRNARALEVARRITALYPGAGTGYALEGAALLGLGRPLEAREALRRARAGSWQSGADAERPAIDAALRALERSGAHP